jgi:microcystin-dependent protein
LASTNPPTTNTGQGGLSASFNAGDKVYAASGSPANVPYSPTAVGMAGGNLPVSIQSPALAMLWCVAWNGIFPSRP